MTDSLPETVLAELRCLRDAIAGADLWPHPCSDGSCSTAVERVEHELAVRLPADYLAFCRLVAGARWSLWNLLRPCPGSCDVNTSLLAVHRWVRQDPTFPSHLIPFFANGLGDYDCFDTSRPTTHGYVIVLWRHDAMDDDEHPTLDLQDSFLVWLRSQAREILERNKP